MKNIACCLLLASLTALMVKFIALPLAFTITLAVLVNIVKQVLSYFAFHIVRIVFIINIITTVDIIKITENIIIYCIMAIGIAPY